MNVQDWKYMQHHVQLFNAGLHVTTIEYEVTRHKQELLNLKQTPESKEALAEADKLLHELALVDR